MATLLEQLEGLRTLRPNWDGYNADAPIPAVVDMAVTFAADFDELTSMLAATPFAPQSVRVYPTRVGGVQFELDNDQFGMEIEFNPDWSLGLLVVEKSTGATREERIPLKHTPVPADLHARLREFEALFAGAA